MRYSTLCMMSTGEYVFVITGDYFDDISCLTVESPA